MQPTAREQDGSELPDGHYLRGLGMRVAYEAGFAVGRAEVHPSMFAEGTRRLRIGVLASLVDIAAGHAPDGPRAPTVDLRVRVTGALPEAGELALAARALRVGRTLVVSETSLRDAAGREFARATATFLNQPFRQSTFASAHPPFGRIASFERLLGARRVDAATLEVAPTPQLGNGPVGTVQGGAQALLAELAAEHVLGAGAEVVDLEMRYLDRLRVGPLRAHAVCEGAAGALEAVRVRLCDAGDGDRLVSAASLWVRAPKR